MARTIAGLRVFILIAACSAAGHAQEAAQPGSTHRIHYPAACFEYTAEHLGCLDYTTRTPEQEHVAQAHRWEHGTVTARRDVRAGSLAAQVP